jgi:hypothetical protein
MIDPYCSPQRLFAFFDNAELSDLDACFAVLRRAYKHKEKSFYENLCRNRENCALAIQFYGKLRNQYEVVDAEEPLKQALRAGRFIDPFAEPNLQRYLLVLNNSNKRKRVD